MKASKCAILYSGGTDSTCAAYLACERFDEIHLLTFHERATLHSPLPIENVKKLRERFPDKKIVHESFSTDTLVKKLSYENYFRRLLKFGILLLSNPGFSSLSWHAGAALYCRKHGITELHDGLTRELMHFPGHMDFFLERARKFHSRSGVTYSNPVRAWDHPEDIQLAERLVIAQAATIGKTTGRFLFEKKFFESANIKGTRQDHFMQHDCYPFITYNIMLFWVYLKLWPWNRFVESLRSLFELKFNWLEARLDSPELQKWIKCDAIH